jgi:hypothetical protein
MFRGSDDTRCMRAFQCNLSVNSGAVAVQYHMLLAMFTLLLVRNVPKSLVLLDEQTHEVVVI